MTWFSQSMSREKVIKGTGSLHLRISHEVFQVRYAACLPCWYKPLYPALVNRDLRPLDPQPSYLCP